MHIIIAHDYGTAIHFEKGLHMPQHQLHTPVEILNQPHLMDQLP